MGGSYSAAETSDTASAVDWLRVCRDATTRIGAMLAERPIQERRIEIGTLGWRSRRSAARSPSANLSCAS
jgi:hypothetical protein